MVIPTQRLVDSMQGAASELHTAQLELSPRGKKLLESFQKRETELKLRVEEEHSADEIPESAYEAYERAADHLRLPPPLRSNPPKPTWPLREDPLTRWEVQSDILC